MRRRQYRGPRPEGKASAARLLLLLCLAWLGASASAAAQPLSMVNLTHSFVPGPYSAIAVDPSNPNRIAVATSKGEISYSVDGGLIASEMYAIVARRYDAMAIRGGSRAGLSGAHPKEQRATRLFLHLLREGAPSPRWAHWMAMGQPVTEISDIALPVARGDLFVAGPYGIVLGQDRGAAWLRVLGGPGPMMKDKDLMALSVVIDPANALHVLAATDRGVYVSEDGGANFRPHPASALADRFITRWYWDKANPDLLFALDSYEVLLSDDRGRTFEPVFAAGGEIRDVSMAGDGVFISTSEGLYIVGAEGTRHILPKSDILGAVGRADGSTLAITKDTLYWIGPDDRIIRLAHTSVSDAYMRLVGGGGVAWLLSKQTVMRLGPPLERHTPRNYKPPRMLLSLRQLERAVLRNTELGAPEKTRLYERWYAKWLPRLVVEAQGQLDADNRIAFDGTFPVRYMRAEAGQRDEINFSAMAFWDLQKFLPGSNASNPYAFIESNLRENRKAILEEVRWRYRECAALVGQLKVAPADPLLEVAWRGRLAEYASYLEFMSGRDVLADFMEESK